MEQPCSQAPCVRRPQPAPTGTCKVAHAILSLLILFLDVQTPSSAPGAPPCATAAPPPADAARACTCCAADAAQVRLYDRLQRGCRPLGNLNTLGKCGPQLICCSRVAPAPPQGVQQLRICIAACVGLSGIVTLHAPMHPAPSLAFPCSRAAGDVAKAAGRDYCMSCCVISFREFTYAADCGSRRGQDLTARLPIWVASALLAPPLHLQSAPSWPRAGTPRTALRSPRSTTFRYVGADVVL